MIDLIFFDYSVLRLGLGLQLNNTTLVCLRQAKLKDDALHHRMEQSEIDIPFSPEYKPFTTVTEFRSV